MDAMTAYCRCEHFK